MVFSSLFGSLSPKRPALELPPEGLGDIKQKLVNIANIYKEVKSKYPESYRRIFELDVENNPFFELKRMIATQLVSDYSTYMLIITFAIILAGLSIVLPQALYASILVQALLYVLLMKQVNYLKRKYYL
jgi:hypothetical protein